MRTRVIRLHEHGGPEKLVAEEIELPPPGPGEVLVRHEAIGLNFVEIYQRRGLYPLALPTVLGSEGAGVVEALGPGVDDLRAGDRVAYAGPPGSYSERRLIPAASLVKLPDGVGFDVAAAMMLKGMTAEYLLRRTYPVKAGDTIVFHAAAGGTGSLATQWARHLGATVIGMVGSQEKVETARANGCHEVVLSSDPDWPNQVRALTNGRGVEVVYDSVGKDTLLGSFECLAPRGMVVLFGQSSGTPAPIDVSVLATGSYFLTRPSLFTYNATRPELEASAAALFDVVSSGAVKVPTPARYALKDAAEAHRALESRRTTGATVLVP